MNWLRRLLRLEQRRPFGMREYDVDADQRTVRVLASDACDAVERAGFFWVLCLSRPVAVRVAATKDLLWVELDGLRPKVCS